MLVLSRKVGEIIYIGEDIKIFYLGESHFGQGKIGIEAPQNIEIYREEIYERIRKEHSKQDW